MAFKVKYVAGSGLQLVSPLSDGQATFVRTDDKGVPVIYDIPNVQDFLRLAKSGKFEAVEVDPEYFDEEKFKTGVLARVSAREAGKKPPVGTPSSETETKKPKSKFNEFKE